MRLTATSEELAGAGIGIEHHFGGGVYAKQTLIPEGVVLTQHRHQFDHLSILASGRVRVDFEGSSREVCAPACILIEAGKSHKVTSLTEAVWFCVHATECEDAEQVDRELVA